MTEKSLAPELREISVAEFFEKNRHLLGFDNPTKSLLTVVKEAVDNSIDACEEARILPDITVKVKEIAQDRYKVSVLDNGPGISKKHIPRVFGKLLYGSKFYKLSQSRGQQGIGISAAVLYSQLTTGKPTIIRSRMKDGKDVHEFHIRIDTLKNEPQIVGEKVYTKSFPEHGVYVEIEIEGRYVKSKRSVDEYIKQTALANPFARIVYYSPSGQKYVYPRITNKLPPKPKSINPHPYGVELGVFERMARNTKARTVVSFLTRDFSRVGAGTAKEVCRLSKVKPSSSPHSLDHKQIESLWRNLQNAKLMKPPTNCLSPIGQDVLEKAIAKDLETEFVVAITRPVSVYRGNPFGIEVCIGYGGPKLKPNSPAEIIRIANRVPLLYEASSCATVKAIKTIDWRHYKVDVQNKMPYGPFVILIHMYSTWIPYTSESKEAIDAYPIILKEIRLALQDCLRKLARFLAGKHRRQLEKKRQSLFERYIPELAYTLNKLTGAEKEKIIKEMEKILKSNRSGSGEND